MGTGVMGSGTKLGTWVRVPQWAPGFGYGDMELGTYMFITQFGDESIGR